MLFKLDYVTDLPRYVLQGHFQMVFDDKNCYQHVLLHNSSCTFFGFQWSGWYFVFRVLPFRWKASAYVYHTMGLAVIYTIHSCGVPIFQYIDDRYAGQLMRFSKSSDPRAPSQAHGAAAAYIACFSMIRAGYFISLKKSQLVPATIMRFWWFLINSLNQAFIIPLDKREKFLTLLHGVLEKKWVAQKTLQHLAGKIISFNLTLPMCKLYTREILATISFQSKNNQQAVQLKPRVRQELSYWQSPDVWQQHLPWRGEKHSVVEVHSDASKTGWGAVLRQCGRETVIHDYWLDATPQINILEACAVEQALHSLAPQIENSRVDVWSDSQVVVRSWRRQGSRNSQINDVFKRIVHCAQQHNLDLNLAFLPSPSNIADVPSRLLSDADCTLTSSASLAVQQKYGPRF